MSGILIRLLVFIGLLAGAAVHGTIASRTVDGAIDISMTGMNVAGCDMIKGGKMKPVDCASICAVAVADLARVTPLRHPSMRPLWRFADLSADGLQPSPSPTPPRA